jgi:mannose-6-phosphate isomerase
MTAVQRPRGAGSGLKPVVLPPNRFRHFYRGGRRIERLRGIPPDAANMPEDWVGSTTTRFGQPHLGLSALPDGRLLRDVIAEDPLGWLGPAHVDTYGPELDLLVKLLDTGQRLIVHVHPDREFAARYLGCRHGKTEAWIIIETENPDAFVYLGFRVPVDAGTVRGWVDGQDTEAMLAALNAVPVAPGDVILVPAGLPHAIGAGVFLVELQEPTDFSVVLEWKGFDLNGAADGHLGLGYDVALECLDRSSWGTERITLLRGPAHDGSARARLLPPEADPFVRAERVRDGAVLEPSVAVLVMTDGNGTLHLPDGDDVALRRGETIIVPYAAGSSTVHGAVELIRCLPPAPTAPGPRHHGPTASRPRGA